ncbi:hypothetical protein [Tunturiibacter gelidoferens]|uniref:TRAP-type uncharacterized transport system fused permease subunit n=1 Tax=Tunturiibacter lichenicola TaxID=2051959 RepID=A0A7Y9T354_9BACT|nr:hypothetical protein [Edaphobacter lichenicola]NYF51912.1 TRAP-type uncharacterized transport system fused permease subunit [Edaphobacter lichenicola]
MALQTTSRTVSPQAPSALPPPESRKTWLVTATSLVFIVLQSACTAVIALSGVRVAIGLSALASATFGIHPHPTGFHRDAIRIPMMIAATLGSFVNLYVIWRIRSLRTRPSSQWRTQPATPSQRRSEHLQIALAVITLILVAAEWITHSMIHRGS